VQQLASERKEPHEITNDRRNCVDAVQFRSKFASRHFADESKFISVGLYDS